MYEYDADGVYEPLGARRAQTNAYLFSFAFHRSYNTASRRTTFHEYEYRRERRAAAGRASERVSARVSGVAAAVVAY